MKILSNFKNS